MGIRKRKEAKGQPWVYDYVDPRTGKRKLATPKSGLKKDAEELRKKIEAEIAADIHTPLSQTSTLDRLADEYMRDIDHRVADERISYAAGYKRKLIFKKYFIPLLGRVKVSEVTVTQAVEYYNHMRRAGITPYCAKEYSRYAAMMEEFAIKRGYTRKTPFRDALRELSGIRKPRIKTFTIEDIRRILAAVEERGPYKQEHTTAMLRCAVHVAAFCGLRWGEIFGLTLENVDSEANVLRVRNNMTYRGLKRSTKTIAGQRDVPMPRHIAAMLREYIAARYIANDDKLVFTSQERDIHLPNCPKVAAAGRAYTPSAFYHLWRGLLHRVGLTDRSEGKAYHFHALRHFASSLMVKNLIPLTDVAALMGHRHFDMTLQVYAHSIVGGREKHEAFERMADNLLAPPMKTIDATKTQLSPLTR